jgi:hypothetical protein
MAREAQELEKNREYVRLFRQRRAEKDDCNQDVSPLSLSSYSSSQISLQSSKKKISESQKNSGLSEWPERDLWLRDLVQAKTSFSANGALLDHRWWVEVGKALNGLDAHFLEREFAKMRAWILENPNRKPTARGLKRFVRTWLERSEERERRMRR